jgi:hydroxymethylpyrimidine pyrophosphatase-like HAD family hydrolase
VPSIELVVTDLDGTLWEHDTTFHPAVRRAWDEVVERVPVLVATGRRITSTRVPLARVGLAPPAIVLNGALGLELGTGRRFHRLVFPREQAVAVLDRFRDVGLDPCLYVDGEEDGLVLLSATPSTNPGHVDALGASARVVDLDEAANDVPVLGFGILGIPHGALAAAAAAIGGAAETHLDRSLDYPGMASLTVAPKGQSKWDGVEAFCREQGVDPAKVLAVADGPNDVELLAHAAVSVVPAVAHPAASALADHTIPSARDGGWAAIPALLD